MAREPKGSSGPDFQYFLHVWREDHYTGLRRLSELLGTDGELVRSMRSRSSFVTYEQLEDLRVAQNIITTIEREWKPEAPFIGHESLSDREMVAILHDRRDVDEKWAVFPCDDHRFSAGELTQRAVTAKEAVRQHLIGGAQIAWKSGEPMIEAAIELRSWKDEGRVGGAQVLEHIEGWELRALAERRGELQEIGLVPEDEIRAVPVRASDARVEATFPVDPVIFRTFKDRPSFQTWFVLESDAELFAVPDMWRRFWMSVELKT